MRSVAQVANFDAANDDDEGKYCKVERVRECVSLEAEVEVEVEVEVELRQ